MTSEKVPLALTVLAALAVVLSTWSLMAPLDAGKAKASKSRTSAGAWEELHKRFGSAAWVDIAFPVSQDLKPEDVSVTINVTWDDPPRHDRVQPWLCSRFGLEGGGGESAVPHTSTCRFWSPSDHVLEYTFERGDRRLRVAETEPWCHVVGCLNEARRQTVRLGRAGMPFDDLRRNSTDPVAHLTVLGGTYPPAAIELDARYRKTTIAVTKGPPSDTFTAFRGDFDSATYVRADVPSRSRYYQEDAALRTDLTQGPGPTFLWYAPFQIPEWDEPYADAQYERPDGTVASGSPILAEVSMLDGTWEFWFRESHGKHPDLPVVVGTAFDWADPKGP